jgi:hypothetical protein
MSIDFVSNPNGLFPRMGKLGKLLYKVNGNQSDLATVFGEIAAQYTTGLLDVAGQLEISQTGLIRNQPGIVSAIQQSAVATIIGMVEADAPAAARSLSDALIEVRRQMLAGSVTVKACTVAAAVAALGTPTGTGVIVASTKRGDGLVQENLFAEVGRIVCTADSYSGGQTAGREQFRYVGESSQSGGVFDYDWPAGSDAQTALTAVSADDFANTTGNLLSNGNFETWSSDATPTLNGQSWATTGTAGTDWKRDSGAFRGSYALRLVAGTGILSSFAQTFHDTSDNFGTGAALTPNTSYAVNLWMKQGGSVTGGVLTVELIDGSGTVINDQQGSANSFTKSLSGLTTSYAAVSGVFRVPAVPPATVKLRFRVSTALTGADVFIDDFCVTPLTAVYTGGPGVAVFSGATPFVTGDTWTLTQTNDRGGSTYSATFQALFDRFFSARSLGLLLPSSGSPSIADSLISS